MSDTPTYNMKLYHKNPRQITERQFSDLEKWLLELGDLSGIVHDLNSDEVIGGNQRSRVFDINKCQIELVGEPHEPDEQGTVALGFVVWEGKRYAYRQVRWTPEQCEKANIIANKAGGGWDWDGLANGFDFANLSAWGFDSDTLKGWKTDVAALDSLLKSEEDTGGSEEGGDFVALGIKRPRWSFRHNKGFLSIRSFTTRNKEQEIEYLKKIKAEKLFVAEIAGEIANVLMNSFGSLSDFVIAPAPEHKTGYAIVLSQEIGRIIGAKARALFTTELNANAKRAIFGERPEIMVSGEIPGKILWIDDTLTTGRTLESCRALCAGVTFIPVVWIYDDAQKEL